jgi:hypothetical protein
VIILILVFLWSVTAYALLRRFELFATPERVLAAATLGWVGFGWVSWLIISQFGWQFGMPVLIGLTAVLGLVSLLALPHRMPHRIPRLRWTAISIPKMIALIAGVLVIGFACLVVYVSNFSISADGSLMARGYTWGDLALHSTIAEHFVASSIPNLDSPIQIGARLTYPIIADWISAVALYLGSGRVFVFGGIAAIWTALFGVWTWVILWRITRSITTGVFQIVLVLFGGAPIAGYYLYQRATEIGLWQAIRAYDYTNFGVLFPDSSVFVTNLITSHLSPQRTYVLGALMVLLGLSTIAAALQHAQQSGLAQRRYGILLGLLIGALPLVHVHSTLVLSVIVVGAMIGNRRRFVAWIPGAIFALALALPQIILQAAQTSTRFTQFMPGWMQGERNYLVFITENMGIGLFGLICCTCLLFVQNFKKKIGDQYNFVCLAIISAWVLFIMTQFVQIQPNIWDNMKIITWVLWIGFAGGIIAGWYCLGQLSVRMRYILQGAFLTIIVLASIPGLAAITRDLGPPYPSADSDAVVFATKVREFVPNNTVVLTSQAHNNPVAMLAGRPIVYGYPGWLASYGVEYQRYQAIVDAAWSDTARGTEVRERYGLYYAAFSDRELQSAMIENPTILARSPRLLRVGQWNLVSLPR